MNRYYYAAESQDAPAATRHVDARVALGSTWDFGPLFVLNTAQPHGQFRGSGDVSWACSPQARSVVLSRHCLDAGDVTPILTDGR